MTPPEGNTAGTVRTFNTSLAGIWVLACVGHVMILCDLFYVSYMHWYHWYYWFHWHHLYY